jgi:hypothetical protein
LSTSTAWQYAEEGTLQRRLKGMKKKHTIPQLAPTKKEGQAAVPSSGRKKKGETGTLQEVIDERGVALKFSSKQVLREAFEIIFEREVPHVLVGDQTVIVPPSRVSLFDRLSSTRAPVTSAAKVTPAEIAKLRRENISFHWGAMQKKDGLVVKFVEKTVFGTFCSALYESGIAFSLLGFQTVAVKSSMRELPSNLRTTLSTYTREGTAELLPAGAAPSRTRRHPLRAEEASALFQERAKKYR